MTRLAHTRSLLLLALAALTLVGCDDASSSDADTATGTDTAVADGTAGADTASDDTATSTDSDANTGADGATTAPSDVAEDLVAVPEGLITIDDLTYAGAFRFTNGEFGASSVDYAVGALAYNPENHSLFVAGHAQHNAVAEYPIPTPGMADAVGDLPTSGDPLQPFVQILDTAGNPSNIDKVTGMLWYEGALIVNGERWYDAPGDNADTTIAIADADDLAGTRDGWFELTGRAQSAGYMGPIPSAWQADFGGAAWYTGWSSVYSIVSRYSYGPSLWTFDPAHVMSGDPAVDPAIAATPYMNFPFPASVGGPTAGDYAAQGDSGPFPPADPVWNILANGVYGFFVDGTRTFAVVGSIGGLESGIGYKAIQSNGNECGGPCAYEPDDYLNYYWFFDVDAILAADDPASIQPYAYGEFSVPFDADGGHAIIGATHDPAAGVLYVALANAAQVGDYDRPPLIVTYTLP